MTQSYETCMADLKVAQDDAERAVNEADARCDQRIDESLKQRSPCP